VKGSAHADVLAWFDVVKRDLPWRRTRDPYAIWISEIMLQQTRVETVVPYFERFLARFPDVRSLARADLEEVLTAWSGLGYYRRARGLHACAREVVQRFGGTVPATSTELRTLPGIGAYTAGAIASIAFGERACAIDGNVTRVVTRYLALSPKASPSANRKAIEAACARLVADAERPGDLNQALMEIGATVCAPANPRCQECPLAGGCAARAMGTAREMTPARVRKPSPHLQWIAALAQGPSGVLLGKRPAEGLFAGLWEPPCVEGSFAKAKAAFARAGIELEPGRSRAPIVHVLTHRVLEVRVRPARASDPPGALPPYTQLRFVPKEAFDTTPMSTLARRLLRVSFADG
jgi:A/G-specific adenine glycosylase